MHPKAHQINDHEEEIEEHELHVVSHVSHRHPVRPSVHDAFPTRVRLLRLGRYQPTINGNRQILI